MLSMAKNKQIYLLCLHLIELHEYLFLTEGGPYFTKLALCMIEGHCNNKQIYLCCFFFWYAFFET